MLNRVLSDKTKLPQACVPPMHSKPRNSSSPGNPAPSPDSSSFGVLVRRLTGAVPDALHALQVYDSRRGEPFGPFLGAQHSTVLWLRGPVDI